MNSSERRKLQWQDPAYRQMMSDAHKGNPKAKGAYSFPKGHKNPNNNPEVRKKISDSKIGVKNPMYNGGRTYSSGYKKLLVGVKKYKQEHRLVMEEYLGRELTKEEVVHHIDEDRLNNDIDNLMLFKSSGDHTRHHHWLKGHNVKGQVMPV